MTGEYFPVLKNSICMHLSLYLYFKSKNVIFILYRIWILTCSIGTTDVVVLSAYFFPVSQP